MSGMKKLAETEYYLYYGYDSPKKMFLSLNARAIIVNKEFNSKSDAESIMDLDDLRPTCKVVIRLPFY